MTVIKCFNINKFSIMKGDSWHHYPQRSELSINMVKAMVDFNVEVQWKGAILDKFMLNMDDKCVTTLLSRFPCIGLKQSDINGSILVRFQISLVNESDFEKCCKFLQQELKANVNNKLNDPISSQQFQNDNSQSSHLHLPVTSPQQNILHPNSNQSQNYNNVNLDQLIQALSNATNSQSPTQQQSPFLQPELSYPLQSQPRNTTISPNSISSPQGMMSQTITPQSLSPQAYLQPQYFPYYNQNQKESQKQGIKIPLNDITDLKTLSDSQLRAIIRNQLKQPEFIELVKRLDKIIKN
ncbi:unnamed protein product [Candida verbasci]|uniref:Uncharacterized protein n=1 Tax=Candida verbasci TaxID=1227364 RepID=A0A9W4TYI1_9ASCO|nr:unnamed protein product [Candida verbasci]